MVWRRLALILLAVPAVVLAALGVVLTSPSALIGLMVLGPGVAGVTGYALATRGAGYDAPEHEVSESSAWTGQVHWRGVRLALAAGGGAAAAVLVVAGLVAVTGPATAPILLLAGFAAIPWVWGRARLWRERRALGRHGCGPAPVEPSPALGPRPLVRVLDSLSTVALCAEWQRSLHVLREATDQPSRDDVAELRRRYLDELERRDPEALARWLATDQRPAATNPARHLSPVTPARQRAPERRDRSTHGHRAPGNDHTTGPDHAA